MQSYLCMMAVRLLEMRRVLKPTGSLYLHCDPTASAYLRVLLDAVFGAPNFRNEIVWCYAGGGIPRNDFPRKHDVILRYSKSKRYIFNRDAVRVPYDSDYTATVFAGSDTRSPGRTYRPHKDGKIVEDWWRNISRPYGHERTGYPTQKPLALLERIIAASSNEGDVVLDPFAGCATACVAAEKLDRQWLGIDLSAKAGELVNIRLREFMGSLFHNRLVTARTDIPRRHGHWGCAALPPAETRSFRPAGRPVQRLRDGVPVPSVHGRPYRAAVAWRDGPSRQSPTAMLAL